MATAGTAPAESYSLLDACSGGTATCTAEETRRALATEAFAPPAESQMESAPPVTDVAQAFRNLLFKAEQFKLARDAQRVANAAERR